MLVKSNLTLMAVVLIFVSQSLFAIGEEVPNIDQLISNIARHEEVIQDISSQLLVTIPQKGDTFVEGEWGYSRGREYLNGTMYLNVPQISKKVAQSFKFAFDGQAMWIYRHDPLQNRHTGRITSLEPVNFTGYPNLNTLLGHDVHSSGRLTVAEALRRAKEVRVQPIMEAINGHQCYVVEAIEIERSIVPGGKARDVRLWIDPKRDYRTLRLERYISEPDPIRWEALVRRVDNIKLQQIDGIWIPIEGEFHNFSPRQVPISGLTKEDIKKMKPEEALSKIDYELRPLVPMRLVRINPESVSVGKEIPAKKFTIQWPKGTDIWDDFMQFGYKVGDPLIDGSQLDKLLEDGESKVLERSGNVDDGLIDRDHAEHTKSLKNQDRESATLSSTDERDISSSEGHGCWDLPISLLIVAICCAGVTVLVWKLR